MTAPPPRIGKYEIERRLGGGGMAEVFVARQLGAEGFVRRVAIKRVLPGYTDNPAFAKMFIAEARLLATLSHPNIVAVLDFEHDPTAGLFLAMELVEGRDLDQLLATGLLPLPVVIHLVVEILRGLGYAHHVPTEAGRRGIVHRDVSPHNVLVSWEGAVKVSDFGIAKARASSDQTADGTIKGKPAYMSPEQANGQPLDGRSDLFAVGVVLWEMLIGQQLFSAATAQETIARVIVSQIPAPAQARQDLPGDLSAVTMRLLEREVSRRYPTAAHAINDLMACSVAPHDGRAELIKVMSDRFSNAAPTLPVAASDAEAAPSILNPPNVNLPELRRQMRRAHARALAPERTAPTAKLRWRWIAVVGITIAGAVAALITITATATRRQAEGSSDAGVQSVSAADAGSPLPSDASASDAGSLSSKARQGSLGEPARVPPGADATPVSGVATEVGSRTSRPSSPHPTRPVRTKAPTEPVQVEPEPAAPPPEHDPTEPKATPAGLDRDGDGIPDIR